MFITFEGIEGSGKSTQIECLKQWLNDEHIDFSFTLEPGGTDIGNDLRVIIAGSNKIENPRSELFLFAADRCEHLSQIIQPTLDPRQMGDL